MSHLKVAGLLVAGFVASALLIPTGALSAAPSLVGITDNSGTHVASVDKAHQLLAAQSDPANAVVIRAGVNGTSCGKIYTVPTGKALVLETVTLAGSFTGTGTATGELVIYSGPGCSGPIWALTYFSQSAGTSQTINENLGSQAVIPQGTELDMFELPSLTSSNALLYGYLVPAGAAPAGAHYVGN
jgi:hypothetical protein